MRRHLPLVTAFAASMVLAGVVSAAPPRAAMTERAMVKIGGETFTLNVPKGWVKETKADQVLWRDRAKTHVVSIVVKDISGILHRTLRTAPIDLFAMLRPQFEQQAKWKVQKVEAATIAGVKVAKVTAKIPFEKGKRELPAIVYLGAGGEPRMVMLMTATKTTGGDANRRLFQPMLASLRWTRGTAKAPTTPFTIDVTDHDLFALDPTKPKDVRINWVTKRGAADLAPTFGAARWGTDHTYASGRREAQGKNFAHFFTIKQSELPAPVAEMHFQVEAWEDDAGKARPTRSGDVHITIP